MKNNLNENDLVINPSPASKTLVRIVAGLSQKYDRLFKSKSFFVVYKRTVMIKLYLKERYRAFYLFLQKYRVPAGMTNDHRHNLKLLLTDFKNLYDKLLLNNYALAYQYLRTKTLTNSYLTEEDKKNVYLQKLADNRISIEEFKAKFGHYAVNPYELKEKRFHEYSRPEFKDLLKMSLNLKIKSKPELNAEAINGKIDDIIPVIIALRELSKSKILLIVDKIRQELLSLAKQENNQRIFDDAISSG